MEFLIGGLAAMGAGLFTNPIEVIKHHMELNKKTQVSGKYKNLLDAGYNVVKGDGIKSLQKGLAPAMGAHLVSYGMKLGTYNYGQNRGYTTNANGDVLIPNSIMMSGVGGMLGQYLSNPFYLLKTQHEAYVIQENANGKTDAMGDEKGDRYMNTVKKIYREQGLKGFFRGATASLPRAFIGTSQLTSFALAKENFSKYETFQKNPLMTTVLASSIAGVVLSTAMTPFDYVLTKLYKQALNPSANGPKYDGFLDCVRKTYLKKGFRPFYKGIGPIYLKLGPHTVLCLVFWEEFKDIYTSHQDKYEKYVPNQNMYENYFKFVENHSDMY